MRLRGATTRLRQYQLSGSAGHARYAVVLTIVVYHVSAHKLASPRPL